jgi:enamine deaminase RidA (YjgF/YER057c/UK114 family)
VFANLTATLERAGSKLADIVTMTVCIIDTRYGGRFVEIRKAFFPDAQFPASALTTVAGFANPAMQEALEKPTCG